MTQYFTDFGSDTLNAMPSGWSDAAWEGALDPGEVRTRTGAVGGQAFYLHTLGAGGGAYRAARFDTPGTISTTVEVVARLQRQSTNVQRDFSIGVILYGAGTAAGSDASGYAVGLQGGSTLRLLKSANFLSGAGTLIAGAIVTSIASNEYFWIRVRIESGSIKARLWADGASEPGTWDIDTTDSTYTSGWVGAVTDYNFQDKWLDVFGVGTNGDSAPTSEPPAGPTITSVSGAPSLTAVAGTGAAKLGRKATGAPSIAPPTAAGVAKKVLFATGTALLAACTGSGVAVVRAPVPASGSPAIAPITASGTAKVGHKASGSPSLTPVTASGSAGGAFFASGTPSLTPVAAAGAATVGHKASGAVVLTLPTAAGTASAYLPATGTPTITLPTAAGTAKIGHKASGSPSLTAITGLGQVPRVVFASGSPVLTAVTATGYAAKFAYVPGVAVETTAVPQELGTIVPYEVTTTYISADPADPKVIED